MKFSELNTWYFGTISQRLDLSTYILVGKRVFLEILTVIGTLLVLVSIPFKNKKQGLFFEVWLGTTILSFIVLLNLNYIHDYYQLPIVSILAIYCGRGLKKVWDKIKSIHKLNNHKYKILVIILILYLINIGIFMHSLDYYQPYTKGYYDFGKQIQTTLTNNNDMVAISTVSNDVWDPTILYFADKKGYMIPQSMLDQEMISYFSNKGVVWLIIVNDIQYKQNHDIKLLSKYPVLANANPDIVIYRIDGH